MQLKTPRGETVYWVGAAGQPNDGGEGTDFYAVLHNQVSISPIQVDLTKHTQMDELNHWLFRPPRQLDSLLGKNVQ